MGREENAKKCSIHICIFFKYMFEYDNVLMVVSVVDHLWTSVLWPTSGYSQTKFSRIIQKPASAWRSKKSICKLSSIVLMDFLLFHTLFDWNQYETKYEHFPFFFYDESYLLWKFLNVFLKLFIMIKLLWIFYML